MLSSVFRRLKVGSVDEVVVERCFERFFEKTRYYIEKLQTLEGQADASAEILASLVGVFRYIEQFHTPESRVVTQCRRRFVRQTEILVTIDGHAKALHRDRPSLVLAPVDIGEKDHQWIHNLDAFVDAMASTEQGLPFQKLHPPPLPRTPNLARTFTTYRPFQVFSVGLLISGRQFCVGMYDCSGVNFSPIHDMSTDTRTFIRLVRSLTHHLDDVDLGLDPSVLRLPRGVSLHGSLQPCERFPAFVVEGIGADTHTFITVGPPVVISRQGMTVFKVQEIRVCSALHVVLKDVRGALQAAKNAKDVYVEIVGPILLTLKNAWRYCRRDSEPWIYHPTGGDPAGRPSEVLAGGDVVYGSSGQIPHKYPQQTDREEISVVYRILFASAGHHPWEYRSDLELVEGIRGAVVAHKALLDHDVLHRDMSPDKIILSDSASARGRPTSTRSFLIDFDFPLHPRQTVESHYAIPPALPHLANRSPRRQFPVNPNFVATSILVGALRGRRTIPHEPKHDLESVHWVLGYCVLRRLVHLAAEDVHSVGKNRNRLEQDEVKKVHVALKATFVRAFGQSSVVDILDSRTSQGPLSWIKNGLFDDLVKSSGITRAFYSLLYKLSANLETTEMQDRPMLDPSLSFSTHVPITHQFLLLELDRAAQKIRLEYDAHAPS
ncbi:hypothetical protein OF83DRAFT_1141897 [Amylostereum chailletii]|nr:hypothetical protein OF83DRAFT_1141897 [Amylostereum chailletii]